MLADSTLDRNSAYNYWVLKIRNGHGLFAPNVRASTVIVKAGYLMRNATISGDSLELVGDFNATTTIEVIGGAPSKLAKLRINGTYSTGRSLSLYFHQLCRHSQKPSTSHSPQYVGEVFPRPKKLLMLHCSHFRPVHKIQSRPIWRRNSFSRIQAQLHRSFAFATQLEVHRFVARNQA